MSSRVLTVKRCVVYSPEKTQILENELAACQSKCYKQYEEKFLFSLLQRQTAMILKAANLHVSAYYDQKYEYAKGLIQSVSL